MVGVPLSPKKAATRFRTICGIVNEPEISVHSWPLSKSVRDFQLGVVMGTRSLPSIPQMVRNLTTALEGFTGIPLALTSVTVIRPGGIFDIPLPSRVRTTFVGDPDAFGGEDGGEDGADAMSLTCYLYMHEAICLSSN